MPVPVFVGLERLGRVAEGRRARLALLVAGVVLIPVWQCTFLWNSEYLSREYRLRSSSGLLAQARFVYFYWRLGLFPVTTETEDVTDSRAGAKDVLARHGDSLLMEWGHTIRSGSLGNVLLFLPDVVLSGSTREPSVRPCHAIVFMAALVAVYAALWFVHQPVLGIILVLLLGSNPFQLYEVYAHENTFGWPISTALLVLALHVPLLAERRREGAKGGKDLRGAAEEDPGTSSDTVPGPSSETVAGPFSARSPFLWAVPVATGLLLAAVKQVRPEPAAIVVSAVACYVTMSRTRWLVRLGLVAALLATYQAALWGWRAYFDHKFRQAYRVVVAAGGHPYEGSRAHGHLFWHPIWCGLGDYDTRHGYEWDDPAAADYALPILEKRYGVAVPKAERTSVFFKETYWDAAGHYYRTPYELPHYEDVLRDKALGDIARDPLWYLGILAQRAWRIVCETTPVRLGIGAAWLGVPMHGILLVPVLALLAARRRWMLLKLACFTLPLSLPAFLVFSALGMCYYSCYHLFAAALMAAWLAEAALRRLEGKRA